MVTIETYTLLLLLLFSYDSALPFCTDLSVILLIDGKPVILLCYFLFFCKTLDLVH